MSLRAHTIRSVLLFTVCFFLFSLKDVKAEELTPQTQTKDNTITVTAKEGSKIGSIYVKWKTAVIPYMLVTNAEQLSCGENGFLHEFIPLEVPSQTATFQFPEGSAMKIYEIRIFSDLNVPSDVQIWQPPHERADILIIPAHSDDEILFMGGIIPTYAAEGGARVQVAYMSEFWSTAPVREHEKLDGLWTDGLRNYPVCGNFKDIYVMSLEDAEKKYDLNAAIDFLVQTIDRFQPQVVVTHDFNGEYGHGFHRLTAKATAAALEQASFSVPKAYFHLYPENKIRMNLRVPLSSMGGQTALEVAKEAYLKHVSQQWCSFIVSDDYKHSCADFGLYRTTVGPDTENNMLENIVLYSEQERLEQERLAEEQRLEEERLERERKELEERLERERKERESLALEQLRQGQQSALAQHEELKKQITERNLLLSLLLFCLVLLVILGIIKRKRK